MKKKVVSALLCISMVATMLVGCGSNNSKNTNTNNTKKEESTGGDTSSSDEGKVLNIYCWNEEFKSRIKDHYPSYEEVDATTGKIGDVTVKWNITPNDDNAYQNNLDATLLKQKDAAADDKIDIFLVEADYALKYVDTDYTMPVKDLGLTDADLANQYQYTKDIVTDSNGVLKGVSWQGCPGALFYNREAAKEVFGTDDPAQVQEHVKDWTAFDETAKAMKEKGYSVMSSVNDSYRVYSNNVTSKWVEDDKINIDDNIMKWVDDSKKLVDAGETGTYELWSDDWKKGFYPEGKVFCYFGPAWLVNFSMAADTEGSIGYEGGWGATEGPQGFFWGGTWICAAEGTDNASLVKDIMYQMTCKEDVMTEIVKDDDDFVNNKPAMENMAADTSYSSKVLGGQNPLSIYCAGVETLDLSNLSAYDQGCNEEFQNAMKNYFEGNATKEEALDQFYKAVVEKYPNLSY
ncbi:ABC transporter substrate-binding protein [Roseburia sp. MSJ-14]|uniref:ABC transporter substrate-binding protein n=1 Tax=Roseburia sp. MSJ-14 TaxID=2841514 RepID=UPI001C10CF46|nr:ABC transporter substrate-binding protein [Roseburia sp. MSJ-14]MBU5473503.1 ABC transporter substrate-binding protein [Roseburia sp. MSJ-14]